MIDGYNRYPAARTSVEDCPYPEEWCDRCEAERPCEHDRDREAEEEEVARG